MSLKDKIYTKVKIILDFFKYYKTLAPQFEKFEKYAKKQEHLANYCLLIMSSFPLIIGALILLQEHPKMLHLFNSNKPFFVNSDSLLILVLFIFSLIAVVASIIHFIISPKDSNFIAEAMRAQELENEVRCNEDLLLKTIDEVKRNNYSLGAIDSILYYLFDLFNHEKDKIKEKFADFLRFIVDILYDALEDYKKQGERFSVAIYLYDDKRRLLVDVMSRKNRQFINDKAFYNKLDRKDAKTGREWALTEPSHVCHIFNGGEAKIFGNLNKSIIPKSKKSLPSDEKNYVSSITIPLIFNKKIKEKNRGVLCVTSNIENSFLDDEDNAVINSLKIVRQKHIYIIARILQIALNQIYPEANQEIIENIYNQTIN